jgi:SAM-dependent methyltransferase
MKKLGLMSHNWLVRYRFQRQLRAYAQHIRGHVLDLGCGERHNESFILEHADSYLGIDWSQTQHRPMMDLVADLNHPIPLPDASADTVFSVSVLEHLHNPGMLIDESFRLLRPGGALVLQVPFQWRIHEAPHDYFRFTSFGLQHLLRNAGYRDFEILPTTGFWSTWVLKLNYHSLRWLRGPRWLRIALRLSLIPFWFANQAAALLLDRNNPNPEETQGYLVIARHP